MRAYCTYFDQGFLIQGLALWRSLEKQDSEAELWVLALDEETVAVLRELAPPRVHVVPLAELERDDPELAATKSNRSRVEYYFTLSPCWPRWLLGKHPKFESITYLDADLFFFASPEPIFAAMVVARASVLITAHRFPYWLKHYERHGRFNVGVQVFRNDAAGRTCLDDWRARCLEWCHDRLEGERYADQKYLDAWPARWPKELLILDHAGVNQAPWNWAAPGAAEASLIVFHFARFRPLRGDWWWQSGHLDYGVMSVARRNAIYGEYWRALRAARDEVRALRPGFDFPRRAARLGRDFWRSFPLRLLFGSDWLRVGDRFFSGRLGLGRWSGHFLNTLRKVALRR